MPRGRFWWHGLALWAAFAVLFVFLDGSLGHLSTLMLYPPFIWSALSLATQRLHDRGRPGWHLVIALIPILGPLWLIITLGFRAGTPGDNQFGDDPLLVNVDYLTVK